MAIQLEFINLVIPIKVIETKYPGGWSQCLEDHRQALWGRVWYDEHLFRDGAMNKADMGSLLDSWASIGFVPTEIKDGQTLWKDLCVCEPLFGSNYECSWLTIDDWKAHLKDSLPGTIMGRGGVIQNV